MRYPAVIFDLFGTLVAPFRRAEHMRALEACSDLLSISAEECHRLWVGSFPERIRGRFESIRQNFALEPDRFCSILFPLLVLLALWPRQAGAGDLSFGVRGTRRRCRAHSLRRRRERRGAERRARGRHDTCACFQRSVEHIRCEAGRCRSMEWQARRRTAGDSRFLFTDARGVTGAAMMENIPAIPGATAHFGTDGDDCQYRIKSSIEAFERVAKESQLAVS